MSGQCAHGNGRDCGACHDQKYPTALQDSAYHDGKAAGYAEAEADIREWMQRKLAAVDRANAACTEPGGDERQEGVATGYGHVIDWLKRGAHVGAAKKDLDFLDADEALAEFRPPLEARPALEWHEDIGPVLWWKFPIDEPPYAGTPLDDDFPYYVTHWTEIIPPHEPATKGGT